MGRYAPLLCDIYQIMRRILIISIAISSILSALFFVASCSTSPQVREKPAPEYTTEITDPQLKAIVNEYKRLSAENHIVFDKPVTMGFSAIEGKTVIGTCTYGRNWREIDIDSKYWSMASWPSKTILVFHEMTHCYCSRGHDYGDGKDYADTNIKSILELISLKIPFLDKHEGYFEDGCATSIMHPVLQNDMCTALHYDHYIKEMFNRCKPW